MNLNEPKTQRRSVRSATLLTLFLGAGSLAGQTLFHEDFNDYNAASRWTVNASPGDHPVDLAYDYAWIGIPPAPNSGGNTVGAKLQANATGDVFGGVSISPTGASFSGDYILRFDLWLNYNGPVNGGGSGSTQATGAGLMTSGSTPQWPGGTQDSVWFAVTGDGGSSVDYRAYSPAAGTGYADDSGVFAAGTTAGVRNGGHPYYAGFGGEAAPPLQLEYYPQQTGVSDAGSQGFAWRDVEIKKQGDIVTCKIDGLLIATVDAGGLATGGANLSLNQSDINASSSGDFNAPDLLFGLIDNVRVEAFTVAVNATASTPTAAEEGPVEGGFTLTRTGDIGAPLAVDYTVEGTATSGEDYAALPGSATFVAGASTVEIPVSPVDDGAAEVSETVILELSEGAGYVVGAGGVAVTILDNETPELFLTVTQSNLLESFSGSKATFQLGRRGLLGPALTANLAYGGAATPTVDFNGPATVVIPADTTEAGFDITPIDDRIYEDTEQVVVSVAPGAGYEVADAASAGAVIVDDDLPMTTVLFGDKFDHNTAADWTVNAADFGEDAVAEFGFDYGSVGIPEAPSSTGTFAPRRGLKFRVNEASGIKNGISVSPLNGNFGGDYRLRFDLWLNYAGPLDDLGVAGTTQAGSAGVGTTGTEAVWPGGFQTDGVWFSVTADGQDVGDYDAYVGATLQLEENGVYAAGDMAGARNHTNPYYSTWGGVSAPAAQVALFPSQTGVTYANCLGLSWHTVTITKQGSEVTWDIDGRRIATVDVSAATLSANVFVGYHDPYSSVTENAPMQFGLVDNVRVENLISVEPPVITDLRIISSGAQVQIDFTAGPGDEPAAFALLSSGAVDGGYGEAAATITEPAPGTFRAVRSVAGARQFYLITRR